MKICNKCGVKKPFSEFFKNKSAKSGFRSDCKLCKTAYKTLWRKEINPEKHKAWDTAYRKTISCRAADLLSGAKERAALRNAIVSVNKEWIVEKLQKGVCELTGLSFDLNPTYEFSSNPYSPSLDRIDSKNKNYSPENTRVVLTAVNTALNEWGEKTITPIIHALSKALQRS